MIENETVSALPERVETSIWQGIGQLNVAQTGTANVAAGSLALQSNGVLVQQGNSAANVVA
jgi:hypothetical protein